MGRRYALYEAAMLTPPPSLSAGTHCAGRDAAIPLSGGDVVLVGAGKMGGALLEGWIGLGVDPAHIAVIEPQPAEQVAALAARGVRINQDTASLRPAAVVIAVKPQVAPQVMPDVAALMTPGAVAVSIMAGRTIAFLAAALPDGAAVVRAMPNTPAAIGRGITVAVPNAAVSPAQRRLADALLAATGGVEWIDDETLMDAVTAVSGSGPAYVFLLAESLARAGEKAGLPAALAARLARATVAGAGELLHRSPAEAAALRQNVTSPGGTTAAALDVLMAPDGLDHVMDRAVAAATKRGRELAG
jgi:pyrroline-5-carboxylate reductase